RLLYFVRRVQSGVLNLQDELGNKVPMPTYSSSIWRANADGMHPVRLLSQEAQSFGPLRLTSDGRSLILSRVDNVWDLWRHRLPGDRYTYALVRQYGPQVQIERL